MIFKLLRDYFPADLRIGDILAYRVVLGISLPTGVEMRSINTRFASTHREDHSRDFFGFFD